MSTIHISFFFFLSLSLRSIGSKSKMLTIELLKSAYLTQKSLSGTCCQQSLQAYRLGKSCYLIISRGLSRQFPRARVCFHPLKILSSQQLYPDGWQCMFRPSADQKALTEAYSPQVSKFSKMLNYRQAYGVGKIFSKNSPCRGCLYWLSASLVMLTGPVSVGNGLFIQG